MRALATVLLACALGSPAMPDPAGAAAHAGLTGFRAQITTRATPLAQQAVRMREQE